MTIKTTTGRIIMTGNIHRSRANRQHSKQEGNSTSNDREDQQTNNNVEQSAHGQGRANLTGNSRQERTPGGYCKGQTIQGRAIK